MPVLLASQIQWTLDAKVGRPVAWRLVVPAVLHELTYEVQVDDAAQPGTPGPIKKVHWSVIRMIGNWLFTVQGPEVVVTL